MINDWEKNKAKALAASAIRLMLYSKQLANGSRETAKGTFSNLYPHLCVEIVFPALKLTQSCYLYNININHKLDPPL